MIVAIIHICLFLLSIRFMAARRTLPIFEAILLVVSAKIWIYQGVRQYAHWYGNLGEKIEVYFYLQVQAMDSSVPLTHGTIS